MKKNLSRRKVDSESIINLAMLSENFSGCAASVGYSVAVKRMLQRYSVVLFGRKVQCWVREVAVQNCKSRM